jgi:hypothetical protein
MTCARCGSADARFCSVYGGHLCATCEARAHTIVVRNLRVPRAGLVSVRLDDGGA